MSGSLAQLNAGTEVWNIRISLSDSMTAALLLMLIPFLDLILVPFLRYTIVNPSILKRLGIGAALAVLSVFILFLMEVVGSYDEGVSGGDAACMFNADERPPARLAVDVYWLLPSLLIVTVAEIFIFIPSM
jgi:dipeptide/tripeptide permease